MATSSGTPLLVGNCADEPTIKFEVLEPEAPFAADGDRSRVALLTSSLSLDHCHSGHRSVADRQSGRLEVALVSVLDKPGATESGKHFPLLWTSKRPPAAYDAIPNMIPVKKRSRMISQAILGVR